MNTDTEINAFIRDPETRQQGGAAAWAVIALALAITAAASWACGFLSGMSAP